LFVVDAICCWFYRLFLSPLVPSLLLLCAPGGECFGVCARVLEQVLWYSLSSGLPMVRKHSISFFPGFCANPVFCRFFPLSFISWRFSYAGAFFSALTDYCSGFACHSCANSRTFFWYFGRGSFFGFPPLYWINPRPSFAVVLQTFFPSPVIKC